MANKQQNRQKSAQYRPSTMPGFLINLYLILMFSFFPSIPHTAICPRAQG